MDASLTGEPERIAAEVRRRRRERGWTLDEAAPRLGVSRRLLAQIEKGDANPALSSLLAIATGFDISLVELLADSGKPAVLVHDVAAATVLWRGDAGGEGRLLVGADALELWSWTLAPGEERRADAHRPGAVEALLVQEGTVTITVGAAEPRSVGAGQCARFAADESHTYVNTGGEPVHFLLAVHEPSGALR